MTDDTDRARSGGEQAGALGRDRWSRVRCGGTAVCPNEMVPLQIDLARGDRRYLPDVLAHPLDTGEKISNPYLRVDPDPASHDCTATGMTITAA